MTPEQLPFLAVAVLVVAFLYSSVGHAGASGYIAVMSLFSLAPAVIVDGITQYPIVDRQTGIVDDVM